MLFIVSDNLANDWLSEMIKREGSVSETMNSNCLAEPALLTGTSIAPRLPTEMSVTIHSGLFSDISITLSDSLIPIFSREKVRF